MRIMMKYHIVLRPEPEGGFTVTVPALPGCVTWGKTVKQARRMARDAIEAYLESLAKHGEAIPHDDDVLNTTVDVSPPADAIHA
ncbi:MAG: type II toxin-antitoxin system HicB family antitoxin [Phycisphaerae bacterium]|nr:type II toxin-antitoxin system HicB family antitoxin [Phycisphaerae bacterium]